MKYVKMFGLAALAAALMAFVAVGTASATTLDNATGMVTTGSTIKAEAESTVTLHPPIGDIECTGSKVEGTTTTTGNNEVGKDETVKGQLNETLENGDPKGLTFTGCNATVVTVLKAGTLEIHTNYETVIDNPGTEKETKTRVTKTVSDNNGTLTSSGAQVTVEFIGFHCIFTTSSTTIGTVTGSANTGATATLDIEANIPRTGGRSGAFCGSTAAWTGFYKVTTPDTLNVT